MTMMLVTASDTARTSVAPLVAASSGAPAGSGDALVYILTAAVVIGVIVAAMVYATKAANRRRTSSHPGLFTGLCQHHKLDRNRRNLLKAIGQAHRVRYAARVFLDPTLFDPNRLPPALRSRTDEILALRQQLFLAEDTQPTLQGKG